ncbi:3-oxosteroid 1-dehydrogenase [Nocardioides sp. AE5]|uniref:3-oxosteroid 1-dehydrogenase n=1 Tax=Nocardioides sp. AE5 TaxID=2962573 RepID=UPI0028817B98|nr:3-oxosteroid 1-dehydrogenase [Nocardioides sp. AE5]MDT0201597.1 3-oxosteroid 1-dehydrogenase [Nocardioides sp. AE5]
MVEKTEYDVIVVGTGGAGFTAALAAHERGLSTLVIEATGGFGGSTARSGGGVWIPNNYALRAAGQSQPVEEVKEYLYSIIGDTVERERIDAFVDNGPAALEFIRDHSAADFRWVPNYSDYYPEAPGGKASGRSVEPKPIDGHVIGDELERLTPSYTKAPAGMVVTQKDYRHISLGMRTLRGPLTMIKVFLTRLLTMARGKRMYGMGMAMMIGMRKGLLDRDIPLWYDTPLTDLQVTDGRVTGVVVQRNGAEQALTARRGVVLACGGFEHNDEMRKKFQRAPIGNEWTTGAAGNTGAGIEAAAKHGAELALMDDAWWGPSIPLPSGPWFCLAERNLPGSIIVNQDGKRYANEAAPYVDAVHAMYDSAEATGIEHVPSWMIIDQRYRNRYLFAGLGPRQPFPGRWLKSGVIVKASTLEGLAEKIGVPAANLAETVETFNGYAATGKDLDFGRGDSAYDRYYGDPRVKPNPSLGEISQGPFYAVKMVPGDLGTKGGIVTDPLARALRTDGSVIEGLYAAGNVSAAVMGNTYAGAGATIGPAVTFAWIAANHIADSASGSAGDTGASVAGSQGVDTTEGKAS